MEPRPTQETHLRVHSLCCFCTAAKNLESWSVHTKAAFLFKCEASIVGRYVYRAEWCLVLGFYAFFCLRRYLSSLGLENERDSVPGAILGTFYIGMKQGRLKVKRGMYS